MYKRTYVECTYVRSYVTSYTLCEAHKQQRYESTQKVSDIIATVVVVAAVVIVLVGNIFSQSRG